MKGNEMNDAFENPLAHNRDESLQEYERQIAEGYCNEILNKLDVGDSDIRKQSPK